VQGKAELVTGLLDLLQEFHRDKLSALVRHQAGARVVGQYDANNTYQYIIAREETQLAWVAEAVADLGGTVPNESASPDTVQTTERAVFADDARAAQAFVDRWKPPIDKMSDARYRAMLRVILGETLEQKRFFEQALAGRTDLLGRRSEQVGPRVGAVLSTRWIE
jgi:hypothetical protein